MPPYCPRDAVQLDVVTNEGPVPSELIGLLPSFPVDISDEQLRHELTTKGVVHVRGAMPRDYVLGVRRRFFETVAPSGVLKEGTAPVDGIFQGGDCSNFLWPKLGDKNRSTVADMVTEETDYAALAAKTHFEAWTNEFSGNRYLVDLIKRSEPQFKRPFVLRRQIFRTNMPLSSVVTGSHYDQIFLRHGEGASTVTAWVPVGDCPPSSGGLMYLEGSSEIGKSFEDNFSKLSKEKGYDDNEAKDAANPNMTEFTGIGWDAQRFGGQFGKRRRWLVGDYQAGDVVLHDMYMIHASGINNDAQGRIRLSVDLRFADLEGDYDERWTSPFYPGDGL